MNNIPEGYCQCGCGAYIGYWDYNSYTQGFRKGQPKSFVQGHHRCIDRTSSAKAYRERWERGTNIPYGLCWCGCGEKTNLAPQTVAKRGWLKGEPIKWIPLHHRTQQGPDYDIDPEKGCWLWRHGTTLAGYATKRINDKTQYMHRYYYEKKYGPLKPGIQLHHVCYTPVCLNPDHLQPISCSDHAKLHHADSNLNRGKGE